MRSAKMLIITLLCLHINVIAQSSILAKMVSGKYTKTTVSFVLKDIEKRYKINFYYSNNLKTLNKEVSLEFKNTPLKSVLEKVFINSEISYQVMGTQIILKKRVLPPSFKKVSKILQNPNLMQSTSMAMVNDTSQDHELYASITKNMQTEDSTNKRKLYKISADSIINPQSLKYQIITATSQDDLERQYREAQKELKIHYKSLSDSLNNASKSTSKKAALKESINKIMYKIEKEIERISDTLNSKNFISNLNDIKKEFVDTTITEEGLIYRPAQIAVLPAISTNGSKYKSSVNNVSLNILGGYSAGVEGAEVGSLFNINDDYMRGTQLAGIFNVVKNDATGFQGAGIFNIAGGSSSAVQAAGVCNIVADSLRGFQGAGIANVVNGNIKGTQAAGILNFVNGKIRGPQFAGILNYVKDTAFTGQFAGIANYNRNDTKGLQTAGIVNISKKNLEGTQISGILNIAKNLKGTQIGIINIADTVKGVQIGLLSFAKNGYRKLEAFTSESTPGNISFKLGTKTFYNIFTSGIHFSKSDQWLWTIGYGLGTEFGIGKKGFVNMDLVCSQINENKIWTYQYLNLLNQLKFTGGIDITKHFGIYGGPVINVMVSQKPTLDGTVTGPEIAPSWRSYNITENKTNVQIWAGFNIGIKI